MSIQATIKVFRKRISDKALEECINMLEEERKRRNLARSDEVNPDKIKNFKEV